MTNKKNLNIAAQRARARAAKMRKKCSTCNQRYCGCGVSDPKPDCTDEPEAPTLTPADVKNIVVDCAEQLNLTNDTEAKLIAENCILINAETPLTTEQVKEIVETCVKTDAELKAFVLECFLNIPSSGLNAEAVKTLIETCLDELEIPAVVTDSHIKTIALQCLLENVKSVVLECLPEPVDIKPVVIQCLLENPQGLTESQVKLIFNDCIDGLIPTEDDIKNIFVECLKEWDIAPDCIKEFVRCFVVECLPNPITKDDVKCFIDECYGDKLHTHSEILEYINIALISAPKPRTDDEIKSLIDQCVTDDRIKILVLECINAIDGDRWTESELKTLIQNCVITDAQVKAIAQDCVDEAGILTAATVNALAKTVALQCIQENPVEVLSITDVKAIFVDCLKELLPENPETVDTNTKAIDVDILCDTAGNITVQVINDDGTVAQGTGDLSKFFTGTADTITLADVKQCIADAADELTIAEVKQCIAEAIAEIDVSGDGVSPDEAKAIAQACIDLLPSPLSYCLTSASAIESNGIVQVTLSQENCSPQTFSFAIGSDGSIECCNTDINATLNGANLVIEVEQSNGPTVTDTVDLSDLVGTGNGDGCCNTGLVVSIDSENKSAEIEISQSNGATISGTINIEPIIEDAIEFETVTDTDGCSEYISVMVCGVERAKLPLYSPLEKSCKRICIKESFSGQQSIGPIAVDTVITIGNQTFNLAAGQILNETLTNVIGPIDICVADVCDNDTFDNIATIAVNPAHGCC